jgi:hypothetical protein
MMCLMRIVLVYHRAACVWQQQDNSNLDWSTYVAYKKCTQSYINWHMSFRKTPKNSSGHNPSHMRDMCQSLRHYRTWFQHRTKISTFFSCSSTHNLHNCKPVISPAHAVPFTTFAYLDLLRFGAMIHRKNKSAYHRLHVKEYVKYVGHKDACVIRHL